MHHCIITHVYVIPCLTSNSSLLLLLILFLYFLLPTRGTQKFIQKDFQKLFPKSIIDVKVGYMGGKSKNPTYRQVKYIVYLLY